MDPDPDPAIFVIDHQDVNKKLFFPKFFCLLIYSKLCSYLVLAHMAASKVGSLFSFASLILHRIQNKTKLDNLWY